jgi:predicted HicB family RNase H-like nuclease
MATDTIYLRVNPEIKSRLQDEARRQGTTLQNLVDEAIALLFEKIDHSTEKSPQPT